jgi:hypothetical protein
VINAYKILIGHQKKKTPPRKRGPIWWDAVLQVGVSRGASIKEEEEEEASGDVGEGGLEGRVRADATDAESILLMTSRPSGGATTTWWHVRRLLHHLCKSHRFKNPQVEMLYQRYFLRMNQSNMTHLLGLLLALCSVLGLLQLTAVLFYGSWGGREPGLIAVGMALTSCVVVYAGESTRCLRRRFLPASVMYICLLSTLVVRNK